MKKLTTTQFVEKAQEVHGKLYDYSAVEYQGTKVTVKIVCSLHGEFQQVPNYHLSGNGCTSCGKGKGRRQTFAEIARRCREAHGKTYDYAVTKQYWKDNPLTTVHDKSPITCRTHGDFDQALVQHYGGQGCRQCANEDQNRFKAKEQITQEFKDIWGKLYDYSLLEYRGVKELFKVICKQHGQFQTTPERHKIGVGCPSCTEESRLRALTKNLKATVKQMSAGKLRVLGSFVSSADKVEAYCYIHKREFTRVPQQLLWGSGCPSCSVKKSRVQRRLENEFPEAMSDQYVVHTGIQKKQIDLYWPEHKFGLEINGVHWHSEKYRSKEYHREAMLACKEQGIRLLQLWDNEIDSNPKLISAMIRQRLGQVKRVYARNTTVEELSIADAREFLDQHHLQGSRRSVGTALGLRAKNGKLAAMMTLLPVDKWGCDYELTRFANHRGITVVGGASKLLKAFQRRYAPVGICSFADLRYSYGDLYYTLGFELHGDIKPDYGWERAGVLYPKEKARHSLAVKLIGDYYSADKTENEYMTEAGYSRVWDCGKLRFVMYYSD